MDIAKVSLAELTALLWEKKVASSNTELKVSQNVTLLISLNLHSPSNHPASSANKCLKLMKMICRGQKPKEQALGHSAKHSSKYNL